MAHQLRQGGRQALKGLAEELRINNRSLPRQNSRRAMPRDLSAEILKRQTVRRKDLRRLVPLSDTTIYELEQKGKFPKRFYLTPRCVVWPLADVLNWVDDRRQACESGDIELAPHPDVHLWKNSR